MKLLLSVFALAVLCSGSSCFGQDKDSKPFRFPGGDPEEGRTAFVNLNCIQCHTVAEVVTPEPTGKRKLHLELGKEPRFVKRYEDIITAIANPRHVIQKQYQEILTSAQKAGEIEPLMPDLTSDMSARQLMDLTAFLHAVYSDSLKDYGE